MDFVFPGFRPRRMHRRARRPPRSKVRDTLYATGYLVSSPPRAKVHRPDLLTRTIIPAPSTVIPANAGIQLDWANSLRDSSEHVPYLIE